MVLDIRETEESDVELMIRLNKVLGSYRDHDKKFRFLL